VRGEPPARRIAVLVHEVRSPTAALAAIADALAQDLDEDSLRELVGLALAACRGIERVVSDAALVPLRLEEVDLAELARDAVAGAALGGARIRAVVDESVPLVQGDAVRLRQALDNLIVNAVTHGAGPAEVVVTVRVVGGAVAVSVADSGSGISATDHARIFEPGVRLGGRRQGSGLGLMVVRAVAEAHGGTVQVESTPAGAVFVLTLPVDRH
jgi:signal transduction histidine kinase